MSLVEQSAVELRRLIGEKSISPVELMQACIAQIEHFNPAVNAICATDYGRALAAAREAEAQVMRGDPLPALHGLPLGVKDLQATAGLLTTMCLSATFHMWPACAKPEPSSPPKPTRPTWAQGPTAAIPSGVRRATRFILRSMQAGLPVARPLHWPAT